MISSDIFCFIPAKAASTRIENKNIRKLNGKELIYYPINAARGSKLFNQEIIVSTESIEIKKIAEKYGAKVPYLRDEKLARDPYGVADVLYDFLVTFREYRGFSKAFILLPTAPLVSLNDLLEAYRCFNENSYDSLFSICETDHNALRSIFIDSGKITPVFESEILKKSQELKKTYRINGAIVIVDIQKFILNKSYFNKNMGGYIMPKSRSVDIDNMEDLEFAEFLIKRDEGHRTDR